MAAAPINYDAIAQQHGGAPAPVDYDALAAKHGSDDATVPPSPTIGQQFEQGAKDLGKGALKSLTQADSGMRGLVQKIPLVGSALNKPIFGNDTAEQSIAKEQRMSVPHNTTQEVGKGIGTAAQFAIPGLGEEGAVAKLSEAAPWLGRAAAPIARIGTQSLGAGVINKANGGSFSGGAELGAAGGGLGEGLRAAAPALAETAMRVRGNDRMFGRTVGRAILDDTTGVRPGSVAASAQKTISGITPQLEQAATDAGTRGATVSLAPARNAVASRQATLFDRNAVGSADELQPVDNFLNRDLSAERAAGDGQRIPLATDQPPLRALNLKRGLNDEFIGNWRPDQPPGQKSTARQAYGALNSEFHSAVPEAAEMDRRVSSLIPVVKRAEAADRIAPIGQRVAERIARPTGALIGAGLGGSEGYREGGLPGAMAGGAAGLLIPEMLSSPTAQMILARGANKAIPRLMTPALAGGKGLFDSQRANQ